MDAEPNVLRDHSAPEPSPGHASQVAVVLHDGFFGASSGTGFSNRAFLEALALALPPGSLSVFPTQVPAGHAGFDRAWARQTRELLNRACAKVVPLPFPHLENANVHDSEALCQITGTVIADESMTPRHVIALDIPFLGLAPHLDTVGSSLLLVPRSTSLLVDPEDHARTLWEREGLAASVVRGGTVGAISQHMRAHLRDEYAIPGAALIDLPNGLIPTDHTMPSESVPLPPRARGGFLFAMGRAVESKGFEDLIDALVILRDRRADIPHLVLAATSSSEDPTPYQDRLRERLRAGGVDATVFSRFSPVYRTWLRSPALRAVIVPSRAEAFGRIPLEAFSAGAAPVVATRVGGLAETVFDDVTGYTAEPRNPHDLAAAIHRALGAMAHERERLRQQGQYLLSRCHNYETTIHKYVREHLPWALQPDSAERSLPR
ncbi:glycosyltransferase family 4 protein [Streptomyces jumonjinensis]|uniref:glycosyltransferase family 4 protein n=1 Tax=Streptomyces jumonjinensis TaxID=1945 RepID=UPI0037ACD6BA